MVRLLISRVLHSPFGFQLICLTFLCFFLFSFRPPYVHTLQPFGSFGTAATDDFIQVRATGFLENSVGVNTAGLREIMVEDESGQQVIRRKRDNTVFYTVKIGDNVSKISHKFGLRVATVLWANELSAKDQLQPGDRMTIPPVDGVYYKVQTNDTLGEIAKVHSVDIARITAYNPIQNSVVKVGQNLFIPGAQKVFVEAKPVIARPTYTATTGRPGSNTTTSISSIGVNLIRPTRGVLTQGYHSGHFGIDIANSRNTPIYASAGGVVKIARATGWNYGYGSYLVIDHGNDVETLYAHNESLKVGVGDTVKTGQLISLMGNSGRVFGPTGIHLHYELRIRGRKVNPYNYFD
jgi:murein DD-endopeptidase MepM/ murein hydrolase activator NlpD